MWLVIGLGNIGQAYEKTRHNIGFRAVDFVAHNSLNIQNISKNTFHGELFKSGQVLYLKPSTYMNLSGKSVQAVVNFYKIDMENIVVIQDDLDLPFGAVRFKLAGGDGGHNGIKSLDAMIGKNYLRCRVGIGKPVHKSAVSDFVLSNFSIDEEAKLEPILEHISKSIDAITNDEELSVVQSKYTLKSVEEIK
jgi:PTH1 family peptidyl-tRNA hydrolase